MGTISSRTASALNRGARRQRALNLNLTVTLVTFGASAFAKFASNISVDSSQYRHTNSGKAVRLHGVPPLIDLSFKQIADSAVDLIQIIDHEGAFAYVNPAWRARLGYSDADLAALTMSDLLPTDIRAASVAAFQSITSGECDCLPIELLVTSSAGEAVAVEGNISVTNEKSGARLCVGIFRESDPRRRFNDAEQQRLVKEISDREQRFRQLFENSPIGIVMENTDRVIAAANPAFHELRGYADGELIDRTFELFRGPETERTEPSLFQQVAGGAPIARGVREYRKKDGSLISVAVRASPIHDGAGNLTHTIGTVQDLSALRWAQREAESQLRRFRSVFDWSPIGIAVLDVVGLVVSANRTLTRMVGYEAADLVGTSLRSLAAPTFHMANDGLLEKLMAGERDSFSKEITLLTRDGKPIHTQSVVAPLPGEGGESNGAIHMIQDVSRQHEIARDLAEREERFRSTFERSPLGMALIAPNETIMSVNPAMEKMLGYTGQEVAGRTMKSLRPADAPAPASGMYQRMVTGAEDIQQNERPFQRKDGSVFMGRSTWAPVRSEDGIFLHSMRIIEDTDEQHRTQRLKDEFLAIVGHELRTPLTSINAVLGLLADGSVGTFSPRTRDLLKLAQDNSNRLRRLVDDLLDLDRLTASGALLRIVSTDLTPPLDRARQIAGVAAQRPMTYEYPPDLIVAADVDRVAQVFANLLANGIKFSARDALMEIRGHAAPDGFARISVTDHGQGITGYGITGPIQRHAVRELINREIAPRVIGADPFEIERIWQDLYIELNPRSQTGAWSSAVSALDIALWDIKGKKTGQPVWRLLGGAQKTVPAYITFGLPEYSVEQLVEVAKSFVAQGEDKLKMAVGVAGNHQGVL